MKLFRGLIIFGLLAAPFGLTGWLGFLYFWGGDPFPLQSKLRDDPRTPSSLGYAFQKFAAGTTAGTGTDGRRVGLQSGRGGTTTSSGLPPGTQQATRNLDAVAAEYVRLPPAELGPKVIEHMHTIGPEEMEQLPMLLGFLRDRAIPSPDLAQGLLEMIAPAHLDNLPTDSSWRTTYANLLAASFFRLNPDHSGGAAAAWQQKIHQIGDPSWRDTFSRVTPGTPQTPPTSTAQPIPPPDQPAPMNQDSGLVPAPPPALAPAMPPPTPTQDGNSSPDQLAPAPPPAAAPTSEPQTPPTLSPDGRTF